MDGQSSNPLYDSKDQIDKMEEVLREYIDPSGTGREVAGAAPGRQLDFSVIPFARREAVKDINYTQKSIEEIFDDFFRSKFPLPDQYSEPEPEPEPDEEGTMMSIGKGLKKAAAGSVAAVAGSAAAAKKSMEAIGKPGDIQIINCDGRYWNEGPTAKEMARWRGSEDWGEFGQFPQILELNSKLTFRYTGNSEIIPKIYIWIWKKGTSSHTATSKSINTTNPHRTQIGANPRIIYLGNYVYDIEYTIPSKWLQDNKYNKKVVTIGASLSNAFSGVPKHTKDYIVSKEGDTALQDLSESELETLMKPFQEELDKLAREDAAALKPKKRKKTRKGKSKKRRKSKTKRRR